MKPGILLRTSFLFAVFLSFSCGSSAPSDEVSSQDAIQEVRWGTPDLAEDNLQEEVSSDAWDSQEEVAPVSDILDEGLADLEPEAEIHTQDLEEQEVVPVTCTPNPCTQPPDNQCYVDEVTLISFHSPGVCTLSEGEVSCQYPSMQTDCSETGQVCSEGQCIYESGTPCDPNPCDEAPTPSCDGDLRTSYSVPGTCTELSGAPQCDYASQVVDCAASGKVCQDGACITPEIPINNPGQSGDLIFSEFMAKSQGSTDYGEWFELYNPTQETFNLLGCVVSDADTDAHAISESLEIAPQGYLLLARSAEASENHGLNPDYVYSGVLFSNTEDELILTCGETLIDRVDYVASWVREGESIQLSTNHYSAADNYGFEAWCFGTASYGPDALKGTPGTGNFECQIAVDPCTPNPCLTAPTTSCKADGVTQVVPQSPGTCTPDGEDFACQYGESLVDCSLQGQICQDGQCVEEPQNGVPDAAGEVIFSEFMARSIIGTGDPGEWMELYNTTGAPLDLEGCELSDSSTNHVITGSLVIPAGGYLLLAASSVPTENHGLEPDYVYTTIVLSNSGEPLNLTCSGVLIDTFIYASSWVLLGTSFQLSIDHLNAVDNDAAASWCAGTAVYGPDGMLGTPGTSNAACP